MVETERVVQAASTKHGIIIHPGLEFNEVVVADGDRGTYDIIMRYVEEYSAAGGVPDIFAPSSWHNYPTEIGPEGDKWTFVTRARDADELDDLIEGRLVVPYQDDDFSDNTTLGSRWTTSGSGWSIANDILSDVDTGSDPAYEMVVLDNESFGDLVLEAKVRLVNPSLSGSDWAGIHFRKAAPFDLAWHSGYTVYVRENGDVALYKPSGEIDSATSTGLDPTGFLHVRVEAVGSRIRVYVESERLIDVTDTTYTSGLVSLDVNGIAADFDDFELTAVPQPTAGFANGFLQSSALDAWDVVSGTWTLDTVNHELDQTLMTGLAQIARHDHAVYGSFRLSALVRLDAPHNGWAGVFLRRTDETAMPWVDGYTVYLQESGGGVQVVLYEAGVVLETVTTSGTSATADFAQLEVVFVDHRVVVSVNGEELISHFDDTFETGQVGLVTLDQKATYDDVILDTLSE